MLESNAAPTHDTPTGKPWHDWKNHVAPDAFVRAVWGRLDFPSGERVRRNLDFASHALFASRGGRRRPPLRDFYRVSSSRKAIILLAGINSNTYEIRISIRDAGAGAHHRGDGVGADRDALCHSRTGSGSASTGRVGASGGGAGGYGTGIANVDRAPILQSTDS